MNDFLTVTTAMWESPLIKFLAAIGLLLLGIQLCARFAVWCLTQLEGSDAEWDDVDWSEVRR
ncbi:hypothetical protein LRP67_16410 [Nocardioides sp. cx-169]|uniref:hypothetical protein n=1 Tax=Nocardioides sp. cx-169 TaxID=2899080 RepID=UPI001E54BB72|nr:hypothetical protein [Nocardioides sp. cx-169]MCD4535677.1 hypothetical protein [Nocardioides sp. cx-169]